MSKRSTKKRVQQWRRNQRIIRTTVGRAAVQANFWRASSPSTLQRVLEICLSVPRTATTLLPEIENLQLQGPSLIVDAPLKLWVKLHDSESLSQLHQALIAACAKYLLTGMKLPAERINRIREVAEREVRWREKNPRVDDKRRRMHPSVQHGGHTFVEHHRAPSSQDHACQAPNRSDQS